MYKSILSTIWKNLPRYVRRKIIRTTQETFTVSVAGIITNEKNEVLILNHVLRVASGWGIPGGFIARGEQPEQALHREISEETGLEIKNLKLVRVRTFNRHIEIMFRAKGIGAAEVKSREIKEAAWFKPDELPENMNKTQKSVIEKLLNKNKK